MGKSRERSKDSKRNKKDSKFFGWREGDGSDPNAKKGEDFMNYGYPSEVRHRKVIRRHIEDEITRSELKQIKDYYHA